MLDSKRINDDYKEVVKSLLNHYNLINGNIINKDREALINRYPNDVILFKAKVKNVGATGDIIYEGDLNLSNELNAIHQIARHLKTELVICMYTGDEVYSTISGMLTLTETVGETFVHNTFLGNNNVYKYIQENTNERLNCGKCRNYDVCKQQIKGTILANKYCINYHSVKEK